MAHVLSGVVSWSSVLASSHPSFDLVLIIVAVVIVARFVFSMSRGRVRIDGKVIVRCSRGHVFPTAWNSLGALAAIRLGNARYQRCPVGNHWSLVRPVTEENFTDEERRTVGYDNDTSS
ncbi:MAG: hypothetical protein ABSC34_03785 [Acidimicrobiales bacterium]|jgi:hypothetical protein